MSLGHKHLTASSQGNGHGLGCFVGTWKRCTRCSERLQRTLLVGDVGKEAPLGEACFLPLEGAGLQMLIGSTPFPLAQRGRGMGEDLAQEGLELTPKT